MSIQSTTCPHCDTEYTVATYFVHSPSNTKPREGDAVLCVQCGQWCIYADAEDGGLRKPNRGEVRFLDNDPRAKLVRQAWGDITATRN